MAEFVCACEERFRSVCEGLPVDNEHEGKHFCVLHSPSKDKTLAAFEGAIEKKFKDKDFDFRGVYFPGKQSLAHFLPNVTFEGTVDFSEATFEGEANFSNATFKKNATFYNATFKKRAEFYNATFKKRAYFSEATFEGEANFPNVAFEEEASFPNATFEGANFSEATFKTREASFSKATFKKNATFYNATFKKDATFEGEASFSKAIFKKGEVSFSKATFKEEAYFSEATFEKRASFSKATFEGEAYFSEATFEEGANFSEATFEGEASFSKAIFKKGEVSFSKATFEGEASFPNATFEKRASFSKATFKEEAYFSEATFEEEANFSEATFEGEASFSNATFKKGAEFYRTIFKEKGSFSYLRTSPQTFLSFRAAVIEKPERLSFHSTHLRPSWFIDVDAQKFDFSDVEWFRLPNADGLPDRDEEELKLEKEIEAVEARDYGPPLTKPGSLRKLQKACRKLMDNAEENRDYATATVLHYWSMELLRKEGWSRLGLIGNLYWALSGYGERPRRAFLVLVGMWALFAIFYMVAGHQDLQVAVQAFSGAGIRQGIEHAWKALVYSLAAIARLNPEPKPDGPGLFQFLVTAEGLLGPLQIALLALAIRRQVMR